ncbi:MAG TPA: metal/formaldehyde-sensitive transcriptional repressor [Steroidobacteraceae bacterium]|jgi:DNA-binding FrmR family transcriptional regulator|nr:metal/formaldehyde-sensitive transcriptional repressor [Steroidobacteraceae bacterium]
MSHTIREKQKLLARVRRIRGQVEAIERALESEAGCEQVMHLLASTRAAMAGLTAEVVEDHVRTHLVEPKRQSAAQRQEAAEALLSVIHSYLR